ncbi:MAG: DUF3501 family protein [Chloroflexi bacterium]|nr:DUF3501 family protein [Chloroflexota bacterium]
MQKIVLSDVKNILEYEKIRESFRRHLIELKKNRRVQVGDKVSLIFENRETVLFQVQEMMRSERLVDEKAIQAEIDTYNALIPGDSELSATLFIDITDQSSIRQELDRLISLNEHVYLRIGNGHMVRGVFAEGTSREDRISSVHYVKFSLTPDERKAFLSGNEEISVVIDHPNYHASEKLPEKIGKALAEDLT